MAGQALYERYKDALRRGHVASLHGRLDEALDAYAEASTIAPDRPTPHTSAGTALLRRRRPADALRYYEAALTLAPHDEAALLGRAQSLALLQRRGEAADGFDALADHRASGGRLSDAVDAARRGLELAEGRERRRTLERLIERLRATEPDEPGREALERALRVLEGRALAAPAARPVPPPDAAAAAPDAAGEIPADAAGETPADAADTDAADTDAADTDAAADAPPATPRSVLDRDLPGDADVDDLGIRADAALDDGDGPQVVERLLDLAAANRRAGHTTAAIDACYRALAAAPDHVGLHLALVQLYDDRGWSSLATDKLDLLDRLVELDADPAQADQVAAARVARS